jgi:uncharacterized protein (TIRG00374 family)
MKPLFVATTLGFSAVFLLGRAGEVVRPVVLPLRDRRVRPAASFVTIMVERLCDTVAVVVFFAGCLIWIKAPAGREADFSHVSELGLGLLIMAAIGLGALALFSSRSTAVIGWLDRLLTGRRMVPQRLKKAVISTLEQLSTALGILADFKELVRVVGWSIVLWGVIVLAEWLVIRAFGVPFGFADTIFMMGFALVGSMVPTPGGAAGAFHYATALGLIFLGVAKDEAAAIALMTHLVVYSPALFFGLFYFVRGEVDLSRIRQMATPEAVEHAVEDEKIELSKPPNTEKIGLKPVG